MFWAPTSVAVEMPTTRPCVSTSGPPLLPGLIGAVVRMMRESTRPSFPGNGPRPLMIPDVK